MASVVIKGNSSGSGSVTIEAPNTNSTPTFILPSADGTNGQVLQTNGSGSLSFTTPATGAFTFITSTDLNNNATADFTLPSGYDAYLLILGNVIPSTDGAVPRFRTSSDGGSTFDSGASDYFDQNNDNSQAVATAQTRIAGFAVGNAANEDGLSGQILICFPSLSKYTVWLCDTGVWDDASPTKLNWSSRVGARLSTSAVNAVRVYFSSGNIASGSITLYGMKNA